MVTYTPRLGLEVPNVDERTSNLTKNWDRLDKAFSGATWVPVGMAPDELALYDGAIVAERGSGKVWQAVRNQVGGYDRKYLKYPWVISAGGNVTLTNNNNTHVVLPITTVDSTGCFNSSASDIVNPNVVLPIKGQYAWAAYVIFSSTTAGRRSFSTVVNGNNDIVNTEILRMPVFGMGGTQGGSRVGECQAVAKGNNVWDKGTTLGLAVWKDSGNNIVVYARLSLALIRTI